MKRSIIKRYSLNGFTLIEMMIVIAIIGLLAALTLGISSSVMKNAKIHKTEDALKLLTMALQEWELERGRSVTFEGYIPVVNGNYDIWQAGGYIGAPSFAEQGITDVVMLDAMETRLESLVALLLQSESATDIISKITPDLFIEDEHGKLVVDSWGTPIGVVFPGRNFYDADQDESQLVFAQDECGDLTVRDQAEDALGSCINERPYFVSAGPDRKWGYRFQSNSANSEPDNELWVASTDNIYSYKPFLVESAH
jgi:prepilin-type N-terminal cleavage/methylation domain-containing protein